jgi:hypothetical protein
MTAASHSDWAQRRAVLLGLAGDALLAVGFSNLILSDNASTLLARSNVYFSRDSQHDLLEGWVLALSLLSVFVYAVVRLSRAFSRVRFIATGIAVPAVVVAIYEFLSSIGLNVMFVTVVLGCAIVLAISAVWKRKPSLRLPKLVRNGLMLSSSYALTCACTVGWALAHPYYPPSIDLASKPDPHAPIVWVIFDELDEGWLFGGRVPGIKLPNFDSLRHQSVMFSNVMRPGPETLLSLPALLCGKAVADAKASSEKDVLVNFADGTTAQWSTCDSVFETMRRLHRSSSIVGFYHNYGSIFAGKVDHASSEGFVYYGLSAGLEDEGWMFVGQPLRRILRDEAGLRSAVNRADVVQHKICLENQLVAMRRSIEDSRSGFIFLHIGLPHAPWIDTPIDPRHKGYLVNLVLADRFLGEIRQSLVRAGTWNSSTLIVSSDHNFRQEMNGRALNDKVPLLVKLANERTELDSSLPARGIDERWLVEAVANGKLKTPGQAVSFMTGRSAR